MCVSIFGDQTISKCPCNLFLVIEPIGTVVAYFSDLQCHAHDSVLVVLSWATEQVTCL